MLRQSLRLLITHHVVAHTTPNPECFMFKSTKEHFLPDGMTCNVPSETYAPVHPVSHMIFSQYDREIKSVFIAPEYVTVTKWNDVEWDADLEHGVQHILGEFLQNSDPIPPDELNSDMFMRDEDTRILPDDSEVVQCIKELIVGHVRPMVQRDGGNVRFIRFREKDGVVELEMLGACASCPSSANTLKDGIERMMNHFIEEVTEVIEVRPKEKKERKTELMEQKKLSAVNVSEVKNQARDVLAEDMQDPEAKVYRRKVQDLTDFDD